MMQRRQQHLGLRATLIVETVVRQQHLEEHCWTYSVCIEGQAGSDPGLTRLSAA